MTVSSNKTHLAQAALKNKNDPERPAAVEEYIEVFGKKPHHLIGTKEMRKRIEAKKAEPKPEPTPEPAPAPKPPEQPGLAAETGQDKPTRREPPRERRMTGPVTTGDTKQAWAENLDDDYKYRFVKDTPTSGRIKSLEDRDWDIVDLENGQETGPQFDGNSQGSVVANPSTSGDRLILMKKYKPWFDADQAAKQGLVDEREQRVRKQEDADTGAESKIKGDRFYGQGPTVQRGVG
jgi:hypothetical protein